MILRMLISLALATAAADLAAQGTWPIPPGAWVRVHHAGQAHSGTLAVSGVDTLVISTSGPDRVLVPRAFPLGEVTRLEVRRRSAGAGAKKGAGVGGVVGLIVGGIAGLMLSGADVPEGAGAVALGGGVVAGVAVGGAIGAAAGASRWEQVPIPDRPGGRASTRLGISPRGGGGLFLTAAVTF